MKIFIGKVPHLEAIYCTTTGQLLMKLFITLEYIYASGSQSVSRDPPVGHEQFLGGLRKILKYGSSLYVR
ncbi:hypothetical protein T06_13977 [Trichinella sp. T6]|nr:hypothetical protein T06_13977 [Trichinella sp. T6]